ncbi:phosphatidate cytidylyltransferase [Mariniphaga sediminis]|uniref:Phosphatidate cytidylyltransferase n=1 Tax=Mariniphaga sediminis TaxID=1628158 RepID=A0A399D3K8_9BACT|nr:phosphatidate cytidylyltransferase [Mariniphaga sediminis]RIH65798.1 phosphatidate cytidylyltransferase [Mariniphaga sediminis]
MRNQIALTFIFLIAITFLLVFNELVYRRLGLKGEITRKFAHFTATLSTITFPYLFNDHWYVLVLASIFFIVLFISRHGTQLKSIHDIDRKSAGSYLLPLSIYLTFLISIKLDNKFLYILPILILAICDPMAGILGINLKNYNHKIQVLGYKTRKTWLGSGSFLMSSFIISLIALYFYRMVFDLKTFWLALGIAVVGTLIELFSGRGTDNLFVPLSVLLMLVVFL